MAFFQAQGARTLPTAAEQAAQIAISGEMAQRNTLIGANTVAGGALGKGLGSAVSAAGQSIFGPDSYFGINTPQGRQIAYDRQSFEDGKQRLTESIMNRNRPGGPPVVTLEEAQAEAHQLMAAQFKEHFDQQLSRKATRELATKADVRAEKAEGRAAEVHNIEKVIKSASAEIAKLLAKTAGKTNEVEIAAKIEQFLAQKAKAKQDVESAPVLGGAARAQAGLAGDTATAMRPGVPERVALGDRGLKAEVETKELGKEAQRLIVDAAKRLHEKKITVQQLLQEVAQAQAETAKELEPKRKTAEGAELDARAKDAPVRSEILVQQKEAAELNNKILELKRSGMQKEMEAADGVDFWKKTAEANLKILENQAKVDPDAALRLKAYQMELEVQRLKISGQIDLFRAEIEAARNILPNIPANRPDLIEKYIKNLNGMGPAAEALEDLFEDGLVLSKQYLEGGGVGGNTTPQPKGVTEDAVKGVLEEEAGGGGAKGATGPVPPKQETAMQDTAAGPQERLKEGEGYTGMGLLDQPAVDNYGIPTEGPGSIWSGVAADLVLAVSEAEREGPNWQKLVEKDKRMMASHYQVSQALKKAGMSLKPTFGGDDAAFSLMRMAGMKKGQHKVRADFLIEAIKTKALQAQERDRDRSGR